MSEKPKFTNEDPKKSATPVLRMKKGETEADAIERFKDLGWQIDGKDFHIVDNRVIAGKKPEDSSDESEE